MKPDSLSGRSAFPLGRTWDSLQIENIWRGDWLRAGLEDLYRQLDELSAAAPSLVSYQEQGLSIEGRRIPRLQCGSGPIRVLMWARQHGDEPLCSAGLNLALDFLLRQKDAELTKSILDRLTLCVLPVVNPDGVVRFTRENAAGVDPNRDAVARATPEGRFLYQVKEEFDPRFCFNLHDMSPRKSTPEGNLIALALQAGPFDSTDTDNEVRRQAKSVLGAVARSLERLAKNHVARYDAGYMHRAFGDSMMRWGVSSMLIESGGWTDGPASEFVMRLHALAILLGLQAIAEAQADSLEAAGYDALPLDTGEPLLDEVLANGTIVLPDPGHVLSADVGINQGLELARNGSGLPRVMGRIERIGDLADEKAKRRREVDGMLVVPNVLAITGMTIDRAELDEPDALLPYVTAGCTAISCLAGPFGSDEERESFRTGALEWEGPIDLLVFEVLEDSARLQSLHGLSCFFGTAVKGPAVCREAVQQFARQAGIQSAGPFLEASQARALEPTVLLRRAPGREDSRLVLVLEPSNAEQAGALTGILDPLLDFVSSASQVSLVFSGTQAPGSAPGSRCLLGFCAGQPPSADQIGRMLSADCRPPRWKGAERLALAYSLAPRRALNWRADDSLAPGNAGSMTVFARTREDALVPHHVFVNGEPVLEAAVPVAGRRPGRVLMSARL